MWTPKPPCSRKMTVQPRLNRRPITVGNPMIAKALTDRNRLGKHRYDCIRRYVLGAIRELENPVPFGSYHEFAHELLTM